MWVAGTTKNKQQTILSNILVSTIFWFFAPTADPLRDTMVGGRSEKRTSRDIFRPQPSCETLGNVSWLFRRSPAAEFQIPPKEEIVREREKKASQ